MEKLQGDSAKTKQPQLKQGVTQAGSVKLGQQKERVSRLQTAAVKQQVQLQMSASLSQLLSQAKPPASLLQHAQLLKNLPQLPPQVASLLQPLLKQAGSSLPQITPAWVSAWFATNPLAALTQPQAYLASLMADNKAQTPGQALAVQQALPLLLLLLQSKSATAQSETALSSTVQSLIQKFLGVPAQQLQNPIWAAFLQELQAGLQQVRLSQVLYAESSARHEPEYYLTLPWHLEEESHLIELLLKKRPNPNQDKKGQSIWLLSMRLQLKQIGPVLARVRWDGELSSIMLYTDNDAATSWLSQHTDRLAQQLAQQKLTLAQLEVQTGRIPASLAPDPNQLVRIQV